MDDNKDTLPTLDAKIVSDIVEAVLASTKYTIPVSKVSLKDYISQTEKDEHDLSDEDVAELFDRIHTPRGSDPFYDLTVNEQSGEIEMARAAFDLGADDSEELRIALEEAESKLAQLEEEASRPLEIPKPEKKYLDLLQSEAWKAAVEWVNQQGSEAIDLDEMEAANPYEPNKFPPTDRGTMIIFSDDHTVINTKDGLEFYSLAYRESSDSWVGVGVGGGIWYVGTKNIVPGTWKVMGS